MPDKLCYFRRVLDAQSVPLPNLGRKMPDASVLPQCTPSCRRRVDLVEISSSRLSAFCRKRGKHETFEAMSPVRYCADLFIRYSLHVRKTREIIHQRWIPLNNLERCVQLNVIWPRLGGWRFLSSLPSRERDVMLSPVPWCSRKWA